MNDEALNRLLEGSVSAEVSVRGLCVYQAYVRRPSVRASEVLLGSAAASTAGPTRCSSKALAMKPAHAHTTFYYGRASYERLVCSTNLVVSYNV